MGAGNRAHVLRDLLIWAVAFAAFIGGIALAVYVTPWVGIPVAVVGGAVAANTKYQSAHATGS